MPIIIVTLGFITFLWGIYSPSSRIRAKHTLVSKYSTVNIILFLFICLWKEKKKVILKYNLNYILCFSFIFSFIHSSNASSSDSVSVKLSLPNLSQQEYTVERYLNFNYSTYNLLQPFFLSALSTKGWIFGGQAGIICYLCILVTWYNIWAITAQ